MNISFSWRKLGCAAVLAAIPLLTIAVDAEGHARYLRSEPGDGAVISSEPLIVEIWFSQDLFRREGENWIQVFGPNGEAVHQGEAQIDDDDRRRLWINLQPQLPPGEYTVEWRNLSAEDGDNDEGTFRFVYDPEVKVTSTPMGDGSETPLPAATSGGETQMPESTPTPADATPGSGDCSLGLVPAIGVVFIGLSLALKPQ